MKELIIPINAKTDPSARELIRVWAAHGQQHVSLEIGLWPDAGVWGIVLADLARHVARAHHQLYGAEIVEVLARIREGFDAELNSSTDDGKGDVVHTDS